MSVPVLAIPVIRVPVSEQFFHSPPVMQDKMPLLPTKSPGDPVVAVFQQLHDSQEKG